jgi:hypothetical protein
MPMRVHRIKQDAVASAFFFRISAPVRRTGRAKQ